MLTNKPDWDAFCNWLREYLEIPTLPIEWSRFEKDDSRIIRIDIFKDKPYHVTTAVEDREELCNDGVAYLLSQGLRPVISKAIDTNSPYTYFRYFRLEAV